jgi:hypothetical protein
VGLAGFGVPFGVEPAMFAADAVILPAWTAAAMLVSLLPEGASTWQDHLQMIWDLETNDGVNYSALAAIHSRARRRAIRPTSD